MPALFSTWTGTIERSLFRFIWIYSKRDQLILLAVTLTLFPLLYLTLELPKRIINDAIGSGSPTVSAYGFDFDQITYLMILCGGFLLAVLCHGLLKMRINTMKGVLAERLLRRFRYTLIARILRFPQPYFERTSQGELVSMVTAESEPMGGLMGDAIAQPVLQAGQMLTILGFLFFQSVAFGLAAIALIPLQAWLIPKLQRQINLLNKSRVIEVRALAAEIGEGAAGAGTLRVNGGWRYRMAMIGNRLGALFAIRFEIYQKKFFMKFLNNFITQLTPFFFFSIGGYLVIQGDVTIGALVAALAAYKDLSSPWKELLAYYNQVADMSLRWETITERFAPAGMIDDNLFYGPAPETPRLTGDIVLDQVTVRDGDGNAVLEDISLTVPAGTSIGITAPNDEDRRALAEVLTRETLPTSGSVTLAGHDIRSLHQTVIAKRIGHATSRPIMFQGTYGQNVMMPMRLAPTEPAEESAFSREALRAGNSADMLEAKWLDPGIAGVPDKDALRAWWYALIEGSGCGDALTRRTMDQTFDAERNAKLASTLVELRPKVAAAVAKAGLDRYVHSFDPDRYNPALPIAENLLYATRKTTITPDVIEAKLDFLRLLHDLSLASNLEVLSRNILEMLRQTFGPNGTDHPLFRRVGLEAEIYNAALDLVERKPPGSEITDKELALLLSIPTNVTAEQVAAAFPEEVRQRVLDMRMEHGERLREQMEDIFVPIEAGKHVHGLSVLENALFGKVADSAGARADDLRGIVVDVLTEAGVNHLVLELVFDVPIALGGANLPALFAEPLSISRATIKRPDILILDEPMASYGEDIRTALIEKLRELLPEATLVFLGTSFEDEQAFDTHLEVVQGRLQGAEGERADIGSDASADLARKVEALRQAPMFAGLKRRQLRLLAFGARWYSAQPGEYVFHKNDDPTDGAYMVTEGEADLLLPQDGAEDTLIATVGPGALVGELGLIRSEPRALDMRAKGDLTCLRIGEEEFMAVVENDAATAFRLLQVVAGYVTT
ncbi:ABC transporter transmembrane domain-containing protein [Tateyamaria omphalii]|uniref:ABC transporter ATP-binding protein n=1 Tax=Tateyamaria omphalii TaxID=299262 RepID=A0A1P8MVX0_9RHOB|nr:ABC transporter transmembrane domain-containing protein [Tateyamaria omphalii]APX12168.1 ABC transporter ATP-binding protein [Tateyamaria omphalii]